MSNRSRRRISSASGLHRAPRKRNEESSSGSGTTIAIVLLLLAAGGAAIYYFMQQKKKQQALTSQQVGGLGDEQVAAPAAPVGQKLLTAQTALATPAAPAAPAATPAAPAAPTAPPPPPWKPSPYTLVQINDNWAAARNPPVARTAMAKQKLLNYFREFLDKGHRGSATSTNFYANIDPRRLDVDTDGKWGKNSVAALDRLHRVIKAATGDPNYTPEQALSAVANCSDEPNSMAGKLLFEAAAAVLSGRA